MSDNGGTRQNEFMKPRLLLVALLLSFLTSVHADTVKDREGAVRNDRAKLESNPRWNYNDVEGGFRKGRESGKPLLVVLRCIPCMACMGIDTSVLGQPELEPLLDQFVCVRVMNANALDLTKFQFDYDLSFSALIFNGDGTTYGRYGSWLHQRDPLNKSSASFAKTLEAALAIHKGYPANKPSLEGKQGSAMPYKTPVEFPTLAAKYQSKLDWDGKVVASCVHCHMIGDAVRANYRSQNQAVPLEWIYPQPSMETLGIILATDEVAKVAEVTPGAPGAKAGILAGDSFVTLNKQPLISMADVSWVLHHSADSGKVDATLRRAGQDIAVVLDLPAGWRSRSDISRRVGTWPMRAMAFGGMNMEDMDDEARISAGLPKDVMALRIKHVGEFGAHAAAKKEGFKADDIVVQIGDMKLRTTESALIGELLQHHLPGEKIPSVVIRGKERLELKLPQQ